MKPPDANSLCRECGLCCNGVLFSYVRLDPEEVLPARDLGLKVGSFPKGPGFGQACTAFAGCQCNIYAERPTYCREFECLLLKSVKAGQTESTAALKIIRSALRRVKKVKQLLQQLGDADETLALSKRFRRMRRRLESRPMDKETAGIFGELTLAVHDLNVLLSEKFYPAP